MNKIFKRGDIVRVVYPGVHKGKIGTVVGYTKGGHIKVNYFNDNLIHAWEYSSSLQLIGRNIKESDISEVEKLLSL